LNLSTFILTINFGRSPPDLSIFTKPLLGAPCVCPFGSTLCFLEGLSSLPPGSFLFLLLPLFNCASTSGGNFSLTILLRLGFDWLCLGGTGTERGAGVEVDDLGGGIGGGFERGGGTLGRDGAGVDGRELGAEDPGTVLVLILILGPEEGIGEWMGDGADMTLGIFTGAGFGRGGAGGGTAAAAGAGVGTFTTGAGVGSFFGGDTAGEFEGLAGNTGVACLTTTGCGTGDALREGGADIGAGEACLMGGEKVGLDLGKAEGGGDDEFADVLDLPNFNDSLGLGGAMTLGGAMLGGITGAGGGWTAASRSNSVETGIGGGAGAGVATGTGARTGAGAGRACLTNGCSGLVRNFSVCVNCSFA
jgi:hypothetical protein